MAIQAVEKVGEAVKSFFDYLKETKAKQSETNVINDKKRLKKATNIAEKIFKITDNYKVLFAVEDLKKYNKLRDDFDQKD